jgi:hypothetical protein
MEPSGFDVVDVIGTIDTELLFNSWTLLKIGYKK